MTEQEVQDIINKDKTKLHNLPFPEKLPDDILVNFDEIIMQERQNVHPYVGHFLESVLSKKDDPSKLTVEEGGWLLNVLNAVQPYLIAKDINEFIEKKKVYGSIMFRFNIYYNDAIRKINVREQNLKSGNRKMIIS